MITKKEDLINTYVKNTPKLRREFLSLAVKFGLIDAKSKIGDSSEEAVVAYWHDVTGDNPKVGCWFAYADQIKEECRELTLSDLRPRTRTEYEKVTESIFDLRDEFERGELYTKGRGAGGDFFKKITTEYELITFASCGLYRKVEKEIDWRVDADNYFLKTKYLGIDCTIEEAITRSDYCDEFLELCRVALRANGEIE